MVHLESSTIIHRPIKEVFCSVSDLAHSPEWQAGLVEVKRTTEGPFGISTKYKFVRMFLGKRMEASNEIVKYEQNRKVTIRSTSGPFPVKASYLFDKTKEGTRVTGIIEMHPTGFLQLAAPLIALSLRKFRQLVVN
jgi:uncharacterized membrane protein